MSWGKKTCFDTICCFLLESRLSQLIVKSMGFFRVEATAWNRFVVIARPPPPTPPACGWRWCCGTLVLWYCGWRCCCVGGGQDLFGSSNLTLRDTGWTWLFQYLRLHGNQEMWEEQSNISGQFTWNDSCFESPPSLQVGISEKKTIEESYDTHS